MCLVSISIDPEYDTPARLSAYATRFRADPDRWLFLTGSNAAVYRLAVDGFHLGVADPGGQAQHSSRFVVVDREARIRGYYDGADREALMGLRADLDLLLPSE
jgi:protein SCO1/2